jgi:hypothetical protein
MAANSSGRGIVIGTGELCFDFERDLYQFLLPVRRPGRDAFQYCFKFVFGHRACSMLETSGAFSGVDDAMARDCFVA